MLTALLTNFFSGSLFGQNNIINDPMSGFDVLINLRVFSQAPVVIFTARNFIVEQAVIFGANGFISKPFNQEVLLKKIDEVLNEMKPEDSRET